MSMYITNWKFYYASKLVIFNTLRKLELTKNIYFVV